MSKKELLNDEKLIEKITKEAWGGGGVYDGAVGYTAT